MRCFLPSLGNLMPEICSLIGVSSSPNNWDFFSLVTGSTWFFLPSWTFKRASTNTATWYVEKLPWNAAKMALKMMIPWLDWGHILMWIWDRSSLIWPSWGSLLCFPWISLPFWHCLSSQPSKSWFLKFNTCFYEAMFWCFSAMRRELFPFWL